MGRRVIRVLSAVGLAAAATVVVAAPASAVDVANDAELRAAWTDPATTEITLTADIDLACTGAPMRAGANPILVDGAGRTITNTCAGQNALVALGQATVRDLVVAGTSSSGVGVLTGAGLVVQDATVTGHGTTGAGSFGSVTVAASTIAGNGDRGLAAAGAVTLTASIVSGNAADGVEGPTIEVVNSTVTGNGGIGIDAANDATIAYSTVTGNTASNVDATDLEVFASVLADAGATNCTLVNPVTSDGYNWADDTSCGLTGTGDLESPGGDPQLGALAANGGPTRTQLPAATSPLIDSVPDAACQTGPADAVTTDQRGEPRPGANTAGCDTGAVELQGAEPVIPTTTTTTPGSNTPTSPVAKPDSLPRTGTTGWVPLALIGTAMLVVGCGLVVARRRRPTA